MSCDNTKTNDVKKLLEIAKLNDIPIDLDLYKYIVEKIYGSEKLQTEMMKLIPSSYDELVCGASLLFNNPIASNKSACLSAVDVNGYSIDKYPQSP